MSTTQEIKLAAVTLPKGTKYSAAAVCGEPGQHKDAADGETFDIKWSRDGALGFWK